MDNLSVLLQFHKTGMAVVKYRENSSIWSSLCLKQVDKCSVDECGSSHG